MKFKYFIILLCILFTSHFYGQERNQMYIGTVTFVTSKSIYVKFDSTEKIAINQMLKFSGTDCLRVKNKSSKSIVCEIINNCVIKKGDKVSYQLITKENNDEPISIVIAETSPSQEVGRKPEKLEKESAYMENIRGRISVGSYNSFSNLREDRHRIMTRFSLNADHIGDSKISVESYLAYRSVIIPAGSNYKGRTSIFNIYNLNLRFDATPSFSITAGRKINTKASTTGAIDGLQLEKYFGNFYLGAIGGSRPDFEDYGFNFDLLQYGGYLGITTNSKGFSSQTTLGAMEQTNAGSTDRRYLYIQHYSTISSNLNFFGSMELDIFGKTSNAARLTNLYFSTRYRFSRAVNVMVSYDSRKQIIYYETFQTNIDRILEDDLARQGLRMRVNARPFKKLWAGASYSNRFQIDNQNKSNNLYAYMTLTKLPKLGGRLNISYNMNKSNYLKSSIYALRHSRDLVNKLYGEFYFRHANYKYENRNQDFSQNYYGAVLSYRISRTWQLSVSGEFSRLNEDNNYRLYTRLVKRFYSKKKNKR